MVNSAEILLFEVAGQRHGLPIAQVRELLPAVSVTPLPDAPADIAGVINLRGAVIPVVNVRRRLGLPEKALTPDDHFIVACHGEQRLVLHVDRALELMPLDATALEEVPRLDPAARASGRLVKCEAGLVYVHDIGQLLSAAGMKGTPRKLP